MKLQKNPGTYLRNSHLDGFLLAQSGQPTRREQEVIDEFSSVLEEMIKKLPPKFGTSTISTRLFIRQNPTRYYIAFKEEGTNPIYETRVDNPVLRAAEPQYVNNLLREALARRLKSALPKLKMARMLFAASEGDKTIYSSGRNFPDI